MATDAPNGDFAERTPNPKEKPPVDSRVRVAFDRNALYVAVETELLPDELPRALELRRDSSRIWSDDAITLKFDVALDRRTSLNFAVNHAGNQTDAMALNNGEQFRREYDAVWYAASHVDPDSRLWTVEFKLPYTALGLSAKAGPQVLGFNVTRDHNRRSATYDWTHLPPEFGPAAAIYYGELHGLSDVGIEGKPVQVSPFFLIQMPGRDQWSGSKADVRAGLDVKTRLGEDMWLEGTVLTDFAEVDLDDEVVNLSRFPLYITEKRPFFLSGLDVFEFGARKQSQVFFSRRIGIDGEGDPTPLWGGLKLYGRSGKTSIGLLNVVTGGSVNQARLNDTAARLRYVGDDGSAVGIVFASRQSLNAWRRYEYAPAVDQPAFSTSDLQGTLVDDRGLTNDQRLQHFAFGVDGSTRLLNKRLKISGFSAVTATPTEDNDPGLSSFATVQYRGEVLRPSLRLSRTDRHFDPKLGFLRRSDVFTSSGDLPALIRWTSGAVSSLKVELEHSESLSANLDRILGRSTGVGSTLGFRNGYRVGGNISHSLDVIEESFTLPTDQEITAGRYDGLSADIYVKTPWSRNPRLTVEYSWNGGFYDGVSHSVGGEVSSYLGAHLRVSTGAQSTWFTLPDSAQRHTLVLNGGVTVAATTRLFWENNVQANSVSDSGRLLSRIRWRYLPGSDLFLVYQEDLEHDRRLRSTNRRVVLKFSYWWDAVL